MHGCGDDRRAGEEPEQSRKTTQEEDGAGEEQGPEGKPRGDRRLRTGVIPRRHKSISIDMSVFIFHRGYPFFWFHA